ncbi:MAG: hypothetical protein ABJ275_01295 [Maricaulaceae bacterium]
MTRKHVINLLKFGGGVVVLLSINACASIKLPSLDLIKLPEFRQDAENLGDYPNVEEAPALPKEVGSDSLWDSRADKIIKTRDLFNAPTEPDRPVTDDQINQEIDRLTASVNEYRKDDPPQ